MLTSRPCDDTNTVIAAVQLNVFTFFLEEVTSDYLILLVLVPIRTPLIRVRFA